MARSRALGAIAVAVATAAVLTAAPAPAAPGRVAQCWPLATPRGLVVVKGIVQSVTPRRIVLRALDGSSIVIRVRPLARIRLNGRRVTLLEIPAGAVAAVLRRPGRPAVAINAFTTDAAAGNRERPPPPGAFPC